MSDDTTTTTPSDEPGLDAPPSETDQDATPPELVEQPSNEPASGATREDLPTSGELDAAPLDAVTQEATESGDDAEAMADDPGHDAAPVAGETDPELAGIEEPELSAGATADGQDDLDDLLGMAGADADEREDALPEPGDELPAEHPEPDTEAAEVADPSATTGEDEAAAEDDEPAEPVRPRRPRSIEDVRDKKDLMRLPGQWFVVHTYAGYEQRVKDNLTSRVESLGADDRVHEVVIPTNEVTEFKKGKKQVVQKKFLPGYVLVRMDMDDELWGLVRHTPAVTGFVGGPGNKPVPLSLREVAETLKIPDEVIEEPEETEEQTAAQEKKAAAAEIDLEVGETIRVTTGPFADFTGTIAEINVDQAKLRVMVSVFGRETPLELPFDQVAKL